MSTNWAVLHSTYDVQLLDREWRVQIWAITDTYTSRVVPAPSLSALFRSPLPFYIQTAKKWAQDQTEYQPNRFRVPVEAADVVAARSERVHWAFEEEASHVST